MGDGVQLVFGVSYTVGVPKGVFQDGDQGSEVR